MFDFIRSHKLAATIVIVIILGFVGFAAVTLISRIGKEPVEVSLIPRDAKLMVGDTQYGPGTAFIAPGTYEVKATRGGFADYTGTVTIGEPNEAVIDIALSPVSDAAWKWQQENKQLYLDFEGRSGERAQNEGATFRDENPIVNELPVNEFVYTIGFRADPDVENGIILEIDAITGYRNAAISHIRELGYDPTNFKINFRNYESPFNHE
jgi:hypothetical protein